MGFQQYAIHDLWKVVPADWDVYSANFCNNEFPRFVFDGGIVTVGLHMGRGGASVIFRAVPCFMEVFPEKVQQRKLVTVQQETACCLLFW